MYELMWGAKKVEKNLPWKWGRWCQRACYPNQTHWWYLQHAIWPRFSLCTLCICACVKPCATTLLPRATRPAILYLKFTMNINLGPLFILNAYLMRYGGCLPGNHSRHSRKGTLQSAGYYCTHPGGCQQSRRPTKKPFHTNTHDTTVNFSILMIYIPKYANV
jgi:hypothetical protein